MKGDKMFLENVEISSGEDFIILNNVVAKSDRKIDFDKDVEMTFTLTQETNFNIDKLKCMEMGFGRIMSFIYAIKMKIKRRREK